MRSTKSNATVVKGDPLAQGGTATPEIAALGLLDEERPQGGVLDAVDASAEPFLPVLAGRDQVVQGRDHILAVHSRILPPRAALRRIHSLS